MNQQTLTISRVFDATRQELFAAWTTPEYVQQWLCPKGTTVALAKLDVRVGGQFRVDMQNKGRVTTHTGVYREIEPLTRLIFTWVSAHTHHQETLVTINFIERGPKTELVLTQEALPAEMYQPHLSGWSSILEHLAIFIGKDDN